LRALQPWVGWAKQIARLPVGPVSVIQSTASSAQPDGLNGSSMQQELANLRQQMQDMEERLASYTQNIVGGAKGTNSDLQQRFQGIFEENEWGDAESRSGLGSTVENTEKIRQCLGNWISKHQVRVLLDIPCGDGNWQRYVPNMEQVQYYGFDIAPGTVASAMAKNAGQHNMHFGVFDLVSNLAPFKADMIVIKEVIQHLPLEMGKRMLQHAKAAGIPWLAVTHNPLYSNQDIQPGDFYANNLNDPPFNFGEPAELCGKPGLTTYETDFFLFDLREWNGE